MLLDRLLENIGLEVEPFAICRVRRGWRLDMAKAGEVHLHFVVDGRGILRAPSAFKASLERFTLVLVPPGIRHRIEPEGHVEHEIGTMEATCRSLPTGLDEFNAGGGEAGLVITCGRLTTTYGGVIGLFDHLNAPLVENFEEVSEVRQLFDWLLIEQASSKPGARRMTQALMAQCLIHLFRRLCSQEECALPWLAALEHPGYALVVDAILSDPGAPHTLDSLAVLAGMSRSVFSERFHAAFGRSAVDLLRETRLRRAARLLHTTDLPVKAIASKVGFSSRSHFSRAFKELFEQDPKRFRATE